VSSSSLSEAAVRPSGTAKFLPSLGLGLVAGGLLLLGWFAYLWFKPAPVPYTYQLVAEGGTSKFEKLPFFKKKHT